MVKQVVLLGATGSVGQSTLDFLSQHPQDFKVLGLSAHHKMAELAQLIHKFEPSYVAVPNLKAEKELKLFLGQRRCPIVLIGEQGLCDLASIPSASHVVAAIVGAAGLPSCMAAAKAGKTLLLANKEALVMAGSFFLNVVRENGACLLPLDSEHNALFQCLPQGAGKINVSVQNVWLTASGGPFLGWDSEKLADVTPEQACKHPKWSMGRKISVDSATLMNKGLEVIEAALMFDLDASRVKVVVHPQSTVHALVQYIDGSLLAHLSHPDMRVPIAQAFAHPERMSNGVAELDLCALGELTFSAPNLESFPCLTLAYRALAKGQSACIVLNAANEVAVQAFLDRQCAFSEIPLLIESVLNELDNEASRATIEAVYQLDTKARQVAYAVLQLRRWEMLSVCPSAF